MSVIIIWMVYSLKYLSWNTKLHQKIMQKHSHSPSATRLFVSYFWNPDPNWWCFLSHSIWLYMSQTVPHAPMVFHVPLVFSWPQMEVSFMLGQTDCAIWIGLSYMRWGYPKRNRNSCRHSSRLVNSMVSGGYNYEQSMTSINQFLTRGSHLVHVSIGLWRLDRPWKSWNDSNHIIVTLWIHGGESCYAKCLGVCYNL